MILHLVPDEKVINRTVEVFEAALPNQNTFICLLESSHSNYVDKKSNVIFYYKDKGVLPDLSIYNKVIIHLMTYSSIDFCNEFVDRSVPVSWIIWGGDIHNQLLCFMGEDSYYSKKFLTKKYKFQLFVSKLGIWWPRLNGRVKFLSERVTEYVVETEYTLNNLRKILKDNIRKDAKSMDFFYYPVEKILGSKLIGQYAKGNTILVNHSASLTGNHEYVFNFLKHIDLEGRRVVTPLSYNGTPEYSSYIQKLGYNLFDSNFTPLVDFLPLEEYNNLMLSAEICIYGHWRGEAWGNIIIALYLGAKVILSQKSEFIQLLNQLGIKYYILEEVNNENLLIPLSDAERLNNRKIIEKRYSDQRLKQLIIENWGK